MVAAAEVVEQVSCLAAGFVLGAGAELDHRPAAAVGRQVQRLRMQVLAGRVVDELVVEALEDERLVRVDPGHGTGGGHGVVIAEDGGDQRLRLRQQDQFGAQDGHAGRLGADEGLREWEVALGQQGGQVVAGDAPGQFRKRPDTVGVAVAQLAYPPVDVRATFAGVEDPPVLVVGGRADPHPGAVVGEDLQPCHVGGGGAAPLGRRPARVVADHAADRAVVVGRRPRSEHQVVVCSGLRVQVVEEDARLHHHPPRPRSNDSMRLRYLEKSIITATLQHSPARLVPPRESTGTAYSRHVATVATTSSRVRGTTTPIGACR
jgi:hypothetical protein